VREHFCEYRVVRSAPAALFLLLFFCTLPPGAYPAGWDNTGSLTTGRFNHAATLLPDNTVLVSGGYNVESGALSSAERYAEGRFIATGSLTTGRYRHTATLLPDNTVLVTGGYGSSGSLSSAELYDPATGTWSTTGSMAAARVGHTATLLPDNTVLVTGGYRAFGPLSSAELYDPVAKTWSPTVPMAAARESHTATLLPNGKVLVVGGFGDAMDLASAELYDPVARTWSPTGSVRMGRGWHTATLLANGWVLVAGGALIDEIGAYRGIHTVEIYNPTTEAFFDTGGMLTTKYYHSATLLPNGKVLVTGGIFSPEIQEFTLVELYDPATGAWSRTAPTAAQRAAHTATLLPNGKVLVVGGNPWSQTSAELYTPDGGPAPPITPPSGGPEYEQGFSYVAETFGCAVGPGERRSRDSGAVNALILLVPAIALLLRKRR